MKKILFIILCIFFLPIFVNAKEQCRVVGGNGKDIGSEITCGTESFYVVENKNNKLKLLAKYNLMVGDKIDYFDVDTPQNIEWIDDGEEVCNAYAEQKGYNAYYTFPMVEDVDAYPLTLIGCRVYEKIEYDRVVQDPRAIGTKLVNGKSVLPLYGITYMNSRWGYDYIHDGIWHENEYDRRGNLVLTDTVFKDYLDEYKAELERQGISVESAAFITLNTTLDAIENISGRQVDVELEYPDSQDAGDWPNAFTGKMDIKEYLNGGYEWIYSTTYWLGSGFYGELAEHLDYYNDYYMSNEGFLCALGRGDCSYFAYPIGNGLRPLITVNTEDVLYKIFTKTDGNGTIEVIDTAAGNDTIQFKVTSKKGYKLTKLIITADSGETVVFNEGSIINNPDGTVSIDKNVFTMPFENVTIEARWSISNPNTKSSLFIVGIILLLMTGVGSYYVVQGKSKQ